MTTISTQTPQTTNMLLHFTSTLYRQTRDRNKHNSIYERQEQAVFTERIYPEITNTRCCCSRHKQNETPMMMVMVMVVARGVVSYTLLEHLEHPGKQTQTE